MEVKARKLEAQNSLCIAILRPSGILETLSKETKSTRKGNNDEVESGLEA